MVNGVPNGFYKWDPSAGVYNGSHYVNADVFNWDGATVAAHPDYSNIGAVNVASFLDPSYGGDNTLRASELMWDVGAQQACFDYQQSAGMNWFNASNTGFIA